MVILVVLLMLFKFIDYGKGTTKTVSFTEFMEQVKTGQLDRVTIRGQEVRGYNRQTPDGQEPTVRTYTPRYANLVEDLQKANVKITADEPRDGSLLVIILQAAPVLFLIGLWVFIMRQMQSG